MSSKEDVFNYVMETPQNTNPAVLRDLLRDIPEGSGLPDPSELTDGTAVIAVNGEWKMQEGYGYIEEAFDPITWDGDTEGRPSVGGTYSKVSNNPIRKSEIIGSTLYALVGTDGYSETIEVTEDISDDAYFAGENYSVLVAFAPGEVGGMPIPEAGVYFGGAGSGEYSLTAPSAVHKFDEELIPSGDGDIYWVNFTRELIEGEVTYTCDKTQEEIAVAAETKFVIGRLNPTEGVVNYDFYTLYSSDHDESGSGTFFYRISGDTVHQLFISFDGVYYLARRLVPDFDFELDEGKVLKIVDGQMAWATEA